MSEFIRERDMKAVVTEWMHQEGLLVKAEILLGYGFCDLVGVSFDPEMAARRLKRRKDFHPLHTRIIAVELKLTRLAEVIRQARINLHAVEESYVAVPMKRAVRVAKAWDNIIGLLGVTPDACSVLVPPRPNDLCNEQRIEHQVEKFWRGRVALWAAQPQGRLER